MSFQMQPKENSNRKTKQIFLSHIFLRLSYFAYLIIVNFLKELSTLGIYNSSYPTYSLTFYSLAPASSVPLKMFSSKWNYFLYIS